MKNSYNKILTWNSRYNCIKIVEEKKKRDREIKE